MKMEATITAPHTGTITRTTINTIQQVEGGDLRVELIPSTE